MLCGIGVCSSIVKVASYVEFVIIIIIICSEGRQLKMDIYYIYFSCKEQSELLLACRRECGRDIMYDVRTKAPGNCWYVSYLWRNNVLRYAVNMWMSVFIQIDKTALTCGRDVR